MKIRWSEYRTPLLGLIAIIALTLTACTAVPNTGTNPPTSPIPTTAPVTTTPASNSNSPVDFVAAVQQVLPSVVEIEITYGPQGAPGDPTAHAAGL